MIFVDSSVWIDYLSDHDTVQTRLLDSILGRERVVIGDVVLTEVLQGCNSEKDFRETLALLRRLDIVTVGGYDVAVAAAKNYRTLRGFGITVRKTIDTLIATRCILSKFELLHSDRDFVPFEKHLGLICLTSK
jgi:predicted nucleic acid-binding protein